jgi:hypothetical protein
VFGITGSGKTYWIENYLATRNKVLKLDTKGESLVKLREGKNPWPNVSTKQLAIITDFEDLKQHDFNDRRFVIYVPSFDEMDDPSFFDDFFRWVFVTNQNPKDPFVCWVDELKDVVPNPHTIPRFMKAIYTKGRFVNLTIWGASQEPRHLHSLCLSQPTHIIAFDLPRKEDRTRLADNTGCPEFMEMPRGYSFWYFMRGWRSAQKGVIVD